MTSIKNIDKMEKVRQILPYFLAFLMIFGIVFYGSKDKLNNNSDNLNMQSIAANNFSVSADQLSELYTVASVANSVNMSTATVINTNFDSVSLMQETGQSNLEAASKPSIVDTSHLSRGIVSYKVVDGDSMASIAQKYGVTETQIRWSNGLKTTDVKVGQTLLVPTIQGIAYKVKKGDTAESLAKRYGSNAEQIIAYNDLETAKGLPVNSMIILPSGELPETERPEYEVPVQTPVQQAPTTVANSSYYRAQMSGNRYAYGWCTWYAWQWRTDNMGGSYRLPSNLGNANLWASRARAAGYNVNRTPEYGAVFQTGAGYYGHVGVVTGINSDGSITISDMNGIAGWGRVGTKTIGKSEWSRYNFIHGK